MTNRMPHRGPDQSGIWIDAEAGVALGHRRLSIIDLSPAGNQPMISASGRYVIVYNGEIYNFRLLRQQLESGHGTARTVFRGQSDTEVMLAAFDRWGVVSAIPRFNGMFAFAVWDRAERALTVARDRFGEKPLYYSCIGALFVFASELKALEAHPAFERKVDRNALALLLRHGYIPSPHSIYENTRKLMHGTSLCFRRGTPQPEPIAYWSAEERVLSGLQQPFKGSLDEAADQLDELLDDAVRMRMISDVPLGAFLSGGIDSSLIVSLMQRVTTRPVRTFTIGFPGFTRDEAHFARAVAERLHTDHTQLDVTAQQALDVIPNLPVLYDEPFADSSQIPTFLVSKLTRRDVTVALSGDGADEIFGGYARYSWARRIRKYGFRVPRQVRRAFASVLERVGPEVWTQVFAALRMIAPRAASPSNPADRLSKLAEILRSAEACEAYLRLLSGWQRPADVVIGADELASRAPTPALAMPQLSYEAWMMLVDTIAYLPDDILAKVDRASMGVSLECRAPYLDHRVAEFAWSLPLHHKICGGSGKRVLRRVLFRHLPEALFQRPKGGFAVPLQAWLRGPLREWAEALLDESCLRKDGFFDPAPIRSRWTEFVEGRRDWSHALWPVLMFQAWLRHERPVSIASIAGSTGLQRATSSAGDTALAHTGCAQ